MATHLLDESVLRKKIEEIHAHECVKFNTESVLASIEGILNHDQNSTNQAETLKIIIAPTGHDSNLHTLPYLLHKITCVLNCKCSGGDSNASAMEILKLLSSYAWEAKIAIILASFVVEYAQYCLVSKLYKTHPFAKIVAILKHKPEDVNDINATKSKFERIINLVRVSIEVTRFISEFNCLPSKYISNNAEPMVVVSSQIPIVVYWMTRVVVACASEFTEIFLGQIQTTISHAETCNTITLEEKITSIQTAFKKQLHLCHMYIEEKKEFKHFVELKWMFSRTTNYVNNQKILQGLIHIKDGARALSRGHDGTVKVGVEVLEGKTVLLLISDLNISHEEISKLGQFYQESRTNAGFQYEIVWLPIVDKLEQVENFEQRFVELKKRMPWFALQKLSMLKRGVVRYMREEWRYSKKSILVALDPQGKVANPNAFHMLWTWGNSVFPFTRELELDNWSAWKEWSLKLLVDETTHANISTWIKEDKVICLYGGENDEWIQKFVQAASHAANDAEIKLEMVCIGKKSMSEERITKLTKTLANRSHLWKTTESTYFWKRIESMMYSKCQLGGKVGKEGGDPILGELLHMLTLSEHEEGWALISQGAGKIARAKGDVILEALEEFDKKSVEEKQKDFVIAMNDCIKGRQTMKHHCNRLILPGIEDILGVVVCTECYRPMEKYIMYRCCTK